MPMTRPAASALSEATSRPERLAPAADERRHRQGGEEAEHHGRDAGQDLQDRLGERRARAGWRTRPGRSPTNSPIGPATQMAMKVISSVPASSGTKPKAVWMSPWSARIAACGFHSVPNRNSVMVGLPLSAGIEEEAPGLEQHREDDADGGQDRDRRAGDTARTSTKRSNMVAGAEQSGRCAETESAPAAPSASATPAPRRTSCPKRVCARVGVGSLLQRGRDRCPGAGRRRCCAISRRAAPRLRLVGCDLGREVPRAQPVGQPVRSAARRPRNDQQHRR